MILVVEAEMLEMTECLKSWVRQRAHVTDSDPASIMNHDIIIIIYGCSKVIPFAFFLSFPALEFSCNSI